MRKLIIISVLITILGTLCGLFYSLNQLEQEPIRTLGASTVPLGKNGTTEYLLYDIDSLKVNQLIGTSTTATSTFGAGVTVGSTVRLDGMLNCNGTSVLETNALGYVTCGADGGGGGTPGGNDTEVQFNDGGNFGGDTELTYNKTSNILTVSGGLISQASSTFTSQLNVGGILNASSTILGQTMNLYGTGTSTFLGGLSLAGLRVSNGGHYLATADNDVFLLEENSGGEYYRVKVSNLGDIDFISDDGTYHLRIPDVNAAQATGNIYTAGVCGMSTAGVIEDDTCVDFDAAPGAFQFYADGVNLLDFNSTDVVVNESSADVDFRVESNDLTHAFFVDAGTNLIGIATTAPSSLLSVHGNALISGTTTVAGLIATSSVQLKHILNCNGTSVLDTDAQGNIVCGVDASGGSANYNAFTNPSATTFATTTNMSLANSGMIGFMGNATVDTSNYSLLGNTTLTLLNARSGASIGFRIANTDVANFTTTGGYAFGATYYNIDPGQNNLTVEGKLGAASSSPGTTLSVGGDGTGINFVDNGTSTFSNGIVLAGGCIFKKATNNCLSEVPTTLTGVLQETGGVVSTVTIGSSLDYTGTTLSVGTVAIGDGGTNATSQTTNGVNYFDGTKITSGSSLLFNGTNFTVGSTTFGTLLNVGSALNVSNATSTFYSALKGGRQTLISWTAQSGVPPNSAFAAFSTRNNHPIITFQENITQEILFSGVMPQIYASSTPVLARITWAMSTTTSQSVKWDMACERIQAGTDDTDNYGFAATSTVTQTSSGTSGITSTAEMKVHVDHTLSGEYFRCRVARDSADAGTGDAEIYSVELREQ